MHPRPRVETAELHLPGLPGALAGLRIAHASDLHARRRRRGDVRAAVKCLAGGEWDLLLLTGDYMDRAGDEAAAIDATARLVEAIRPRLGAWGVFGNHDSQRLIDAAAGLPVRWLRDEAVEVSGLPLRLLGLDDRCPVTPPDPVALARSEWRLGGPGSLCLRILLSHRPERLLVGASFGVDLVLSGHTHGGQWRTPWGFAPVNRCAFPPGLTAGRLAVDRTVGVISRGLGQTGVNLRIFCPAELPGLVLEPGPASSGNGRLRCVVRR
jgi:predicted MPP superfamily phosphohydrolase